MRVLLAIDGSASSDAAVDLVAAQRWPDATCIRVVTVVEPMSAVLMGMVPYATPEFDDRQIAGALETRLGDAAAVLAQPGRIVETSLLRGRPASVIVEQATDLRADLVVVGSRGLGPMRSMLLGSVSAEVVDHAPCPVLVARAGSIGTVLVATDGSPTARRAVEFLAGATYLHGHRIEVLTVGPLPAVAMQADAAPTMTGSAARGYAEIATEDRRRAEAQAARAAEELAATGFDVRWSVGAGDPAHEILETAAMAGCDLIVMGSRGLTGLGRLLLGSVARNVLLHAPTSVLIVREPVRERRTERVREQVGEPVLSPVG